MTKLVLDRTAVRRARSLARKVGRPIVKLAQDHSTVSVERATLRLAGLSGADAEGIPWVNRLVDAVQADVGLETGVALPVWHAIVSGDADILVNIPYEMGGKKGLYQCIAAKQTDGSYKVSF